MREKVHTRQQILESENLDLNKIDNNLRGIDNNKDQNLENRGLDEVLLIGASEGIV
jgi:hypothetical protein